MVRQGPESFDVLTTPSLSKGLSKGEVEGQDMDAAACKSVIGQGIRHAVKSASVNKLGVLLYLI
jgi:hypothetical protein